MNKNQIHRGLLVAFLSIAALLAPLHPAYSQNATVTLYDNITGYNPPSTGYAFDQVYWYWYGGAAVVKQEVAYSFSTGNFSGTLSSVVLVLHNVNGSPWMYLFGDDGGKPHGLLGQLTYASGSMGHGFDGNQQPIFGRLTLNGNGISLAPNTRYWVVVADGGWLNPIYIAPCGGEFWWADRPDSTSPRALMRSIDGTVEHDWYPTGSAYVPLMQVYATTPLLPHANAGASATAHVGSVVTLDGTGSSDPAGLSLTYLWSFASVPPGSTAVLSDPTAASPSFAVDMPGDYVVRLVVTNSAGAASAPAFVTISTYNTAPVADPGPDMAIVAIGTTVSLDGSQSYDVDGDAITYLWTFISKPLSSNPILNGDTTPMPTFVADVRGTYVIQLVVSDPWAAGTPETVTVSFNNVKPVANAGTGQVASVGDLVTVDGSGSSDANSDPLTYQWSFATMPANSFATLANPTAVQATFVPDQQGTYGLQLIVNDGLVNSDPSTVQVQVMEIFDDTLLAPVRDAITLIDFLDHSVFRNSNLRNSLINKLQAVMNAIQSGDYYDAVSKLEMDLLPKTDGCAVSGAPDKNDWIVTCEAQHMVYVKLMEIIARIGNLAR